MDESMLCANTHEYILEKDNMYEVGITDYGINRLGDVVFVELPECDSEFSKGEVFGTIESVKSVFEIFMPISGKVVEVNEEVVNSPELLNDEAYNEKWLIKIESDAKLVELADLLDYLDYIEEYSL